MIPVVRRLVAWVPIAALVGSACSPGDAGTDAGARRAPSPSRAAVGGLLVRDGRWLARVDLESGSVERLLRLPSFSSFDVTGDGSMVVVASKNKGRGDPRLSVAAVESGAGWEEIGSGAEPAWSPDGRHVAAVVTVEGQVICPVGGGGEGQPEVGGDCEPARRVVVIEADGGRPAVALGASSWASPGWGAGRVYAVNALTGTIAFAPQEPGGSPDRRAAPAADVAAIAPAHDVLLYGGDEGTLFLRDGKLGPRLDESKDVVEVAAWSPDGGVVAAVITSGGEMLALVDPANGEVEEVAQVRGRVRAIVWSHDARLFAYLEGRERGARVRLCEREQAVCRPAPVVPEGAELIALVP